jgi:hypothetical protein
MFFVVLRRTGPEWDRSRPLSGFVRATLARDPWDQAHLVIDSIDGWTIRLDGRGR